MQSATQNSTKHLIAAGWIACGTMRVAGSVCAFVVRGTKIDPAMPGGPARGVTT